MLAAYFKGSNPSDYILKEVMPRSLASTITLLTLRGWLWKLTSDRLSAIALIIIALAFRHVAGWRQSRSPTSSLLELGLSALNMPTSLGDRLVAASVFSPQNLISSDRHLI